MQGRGGQGPPDKKTLAEVQQLESDVISGRLLRDALSGNSQMSGGPSFTSDDVTNQREPARRGAGKITLRFRVTEEVYQTWHALLQLYCRSPLNTGSFVQLLCVAVWHSWQHTLGSDVAYAEVYERDRCQCSSPVCFNRGVTPHHIRFRSRGGDDSKANLTAGCLWCHLEGIHGGRIKVSGEAPADLNWAFGRPLVLEVRGRKRLDA
jgi:hypothetical protein